MPSSRGSSWPRDWTCVSWVSWIADRFFTSEPLGLGITLRFSCAPLKAPPSGDCDMDVAKELQRAEIPASYERLNHGNLSITLKFLFQWKFQWKADCCQWTDDELDNDASFVLQKEVRWEVSQKQNEKKKRTILFIISSWSVFLEQLIFLSEIASGQPACLFCS